MVLSFLLVCLGKCTCFPINPRWWILLGGHRHAAGVRTCFLTRPSPLQTDYKPPWHFRLCNINHSLSGIDISVWFKGFAGTTNTVYIIAKRDNSERKSILHLDLSCMSYTSLLDPHFTGDSLLSVVIGCEIWAYKGIVLSQHEINPDKNNISGINWTVLSRQRKYPFCT